MGGARGEQDIILTMPELYQPRGLGPSAAVDREFGGPYSTHRWNPRDLSKLHEELLSHNYFSLAEHYLSKAQEAEQSLAPLQERIPLIPIDEEEDEAAKKKRELKERRRAQRRAAAINFRKDPLTAPKPTTKTNPMDRAFWDDYNYGIKGIFEPNEVTRRTFGESWAALGRSRRNRDKYGFSDQDDRGRM